MPLNCWLITVHVTPVSFEHSDAGSNVAFVVSVKSAHYTISIGLNFELEYSSRKIERGFFNGKVKIITDIIQRVSLVPDGGDLETGIRAILYTR